MPFLSSISTADYTVNGGNAGQVNTLTISTSGTHTFSGTLTVTNGHLSDYDSWKSANNITGTSGDVGTVQVTLSAALLAETKLFIPNFATNLSPV